MGLLARIRVRTARRQIAAQAATSTHSVEPDTPVGGPKTWSFPIWSVNGDDWGPRDSLFR